jgi:hypothetical protein
MQSSLVNKHKYSRGTYFLLLLGIKWREQMPYNCWHISIKLYGIISLKKVTFVSTPTRTSNITENEGVLRTECQGEYLHPSKT